MKLRFPHPLTLLVICVVVAAALTWLLPAGQFQRRNDQVTGRSVVVAGTYERAASSPVGPLGALIAIPRGFVDAAEVIAVVLFVGGAWVVVDSLGALGRLVTSFLSLFRRRSLLAVPIVSLVVAAMGALENMQEELIPLVPVLLLLGRRIGIDAVSVVAMSAGAAMVGSAFGPTNPFQAGIAFKLAELRPFDALGVRLIVFATAVSVWLLWTIRRARQARLPTDAGAEAADPPASFSDVLTLALMLVPMFAYVYGAMFWDWSLNELSAGFLAGGVAAGLVGGLGVARTFDVYLDGMKSVLPAAVMVGVARSITIVLGDGQVIDTMLNALSQPLIGLPAMASAALMVPVHALVHVAVPSVSGQAVLTLPVFVPLADLVGLSRHAAVMAYQTGAGLTELLTPTNGALMAILVAARVSFRQWIGFAAGGVALLVLVGCAAMLVLP